MEKEKIIIIKTRRKFAIKDKNLVIMLFGGGKEKMN